VSMCLLVPPISKKEGGRMNVVKLQDFLETAKEERETAEGSISGPTDPSLNSLPG